MRRKSKSEFKKDLKREKKEYFRAVKEAPDDLAVFDRILLEHEAKLIAFFRKLRNDKQEQKEMNAQLYTLFNGSLGVEDKGELRAKINKAHDRISRLEKSLKEASDKVSILLAATMMSMLFSVITLIVVY